ncbi:MAG TPA: ATP-dependent DNA helicase [Candidatus Sulfotelmatobacter sp.]|nr:ATP-dependent DNA helicase [Candidatus Sulfotelmatobacter sp.]
MAVPKSKITFSPDERQRQAIEHVQGPLLVIAGAGTGKTSVLTHRVARLVRDGHAYASEILALTYTKNAAFEMKEKVRGLLGVKDVRAFTFHDYCNTWLRRTGNDFGVLDDADLWIYLRRRIRELRLEHFVRAANVGEFLHDLLKFLSRCHDELVTPEKYSQYVDRLERGELPIPRVAKSSDKLSDEEVLGRCREIGRVFATLERWLEEENKGTFSHMITRAHALLQRDHKLLEEERSRTKFILVDEFQDVNFAQVKILSALAGPQGNLFAVGDPDQAIYRFRGASSAAFELFQHQFPNAKLIVLENNRRSTTPILRTAFAVIDRNPEVFAQKRGGHLAYRRSPLQSIREEEASREGKPLPSVPVECISFVGKAAEGPDVVATIRDLRKKLRCKWSDFGILYRQHTHRADVVRELADAQIPFAIDGMDVSDTPEVRDLFACLNVIVSPSDDISLFRVAALPQFNVDPEDLRATMRRIASESRDSTAVSLYSVLDGVDGGPAIVEVIQVTRTEIDQNQCKGRKALEIIAQNFRLDTQSAVVSAALNFVGDWEKKAINKTTDITELSDYLSYFRESGCVISLPVPKDEDAVQLMTAHLAKGLEFPHVFILRANSNSFPCAFRETLVEFPNDLRDPDSAGEGDDRTLNAQDERRLFYVAMTRARDSLKIYAKQGTGRKDKTPPGNVREILQDTTLRPWVRERPAIGAQETMQIFAEASSLSPGISRTAEWLQLTPMAGLHMKLSASAVDTYQRCPLQFKLERDWRMARRPVAAMQYGAAIHRVLRTYYDAIRAGRPKSREELIAQFRQDLADAKIHEPYQHELYEKQGIAQLNDFLAAAEKNAPPNVLHTEEWFEVKIDATSVAGRIDRIDQSADGAVSILDYKTGKSRDQEDADTSLQLSIYAIAAREKWGYEVDRLVFYNLEENVPVTTTRSEAQLLDARCRVTEVANAIAQQKFDPVPGFHCNYCAYRAVCPSQEKMIPGRAMISKSS